jgi:hypothetical protein
MADQEDLARKGAISGGLQDSSTAGPLGQSAALVEMWRNNLRKSRQLPAGPPTFPDVVALPMHFGGGTTALSAGSTGLIEVPFPGVIVGIHLFAGNQVFLPVAVTTTLDIQFGAQGHWSAGLTPMHAGVLPGMTAASEGLVSDLTGWTTAIAQGDLIGVRIVTWSGTATFLLVSIIVQKVPVRGLGVFNMIDDSGDSIVDDNGNRIVWRS